MRHTIFVRLRGGLGNQLFQLSHAFDLRKKFQKSHIYLDISWFSTSRQEGTTTSLSLRDHHSEFSFSSLPSLLWSNSLGLATAEGESRFLPRLIRSGLNVEMHQGYWQSWQSVQAQRVSMSAILEFERSQVLKERTVRLPFVAVHIRLGDYAQDQAIKKFHGVTDFEQQLLIADYEATRLGISKIRIFTDSPNVLYSSIFENSSVELSRATSAWEALLEMSSGQAIVMSNSSLSWWSAVHAEWLSDLPFRVYMPRPWFRHASAFDRLLLAPGWVPYSRQIISGLKE